MKAGDVPNAKRRSEERLRPSLASLFASFVSAKVAEAGESNREHLANLNAPGSTLAIPYSYYSLSLAVRSAGEK